MGKVWMIASGKGGVGKSSISAALASAFVSSHLRVLVLDADVGLRSLDLMLGLQDRVLYELSDCLEKKCSLDDAMIIHPRMPLLHLMSAGQDAKPRDFAPRELKKIMNLLRARFDIILIDSPAGIGRGVKNMINIADSYVLIATPDDVSLRDVEKMAAMITAASGAQPWLLLNRVDKRLVLRGIMSPPADIAQLLDLQPLGVIPESARVYRAMIEKRTMDRCGDLEVERAVLRVAGRMLGENIAQPIYRQSRLMTVFDRIWRDQSHDDV